MRTVIGSTLTSALEADEAGLSDAGVEADAADEAGLDAYTARFHQALSAEKAAIADMD